LVHDEDRGKKFVLNAARFKGSREVDGVGGAVNKFRGGLSGVYGFGERLRASTELRDNSYSAHRKTGVLRALPAREVR